MSNAGWATLSIIPSFQGLQGRLSAGVAAPMAAAGRDGGRKFGDSAGKEAGSRFRSGWADRMKGFAPLAGLAVGAGAVAFFKDAIEGASDLNEAGTKLQAIYGEAAAEVQDYASTAADSLGQTRIQALDAAATFGTFGKAAGLAGSDLAGFSTELVSLSTDMASFYNTDVTTAIQAIGSGLRGEAEPLRQFGVLLDDATLRAEAMKQGLIESTKQALTPQQKVLAAHAVILEQTADAQGDFERTGEGLANQQRKLTAQWEEMKVAVGEDLLPAMTGFVSFLNDDALPALGEAGGLVKDAASAFGDLPAPVKAAAGAFVALRLAAMTGLSASIAAGVASTGSAMVGLRIRTMLAADEFVRLRAGSLVLMGNTGRFTAGVGRMSASLGALRVAALGAGASLRSGLSSAVGMVGGPWGAAFLGATLVLTKFWTEHQEAKQRVEDLTSSLDAQTGALTENTRATVVKRLEDEGALKAAQGLGISLEDVTDAALGNEFALSRVRDRLREVAPDALNAGKGWASFDVTLSSTDRNAHAVGESLQNLGEDLDAAQTKTGRMAEATGEAAAQMGVAARETRDYAGELKKAKGRLQDLIDKEQERADNAVGRRRDRLALIQAEQDARKELREGKRTLDEHTKAGQANLEQLFDWADQWNSSAEAVRNQRGVYRDTKRDFIELATAMGGGDKSAAAQAQKLAEMLKKPKARVDTTAIDRAKDKVEELQIMLDNLEQGRRINLGIPLAPGAPRVDDGRSYNYARPQSESRRAPRGQTAERAAGTGAPVTINIDKVVASSGGNLMDQLRSRAGSAVGGSRWN